MVKKKQKPAKKKQTKSYRGAWGYSVDSKEFVRELRKGKVIDPI